MKRLFVSIGDPNGIGLEIALRAHEAVKREAEILYGIDREVLEKGAAMLGLPIPPDMRLDPLGLACEIAPGEVSASAGAYSYASFRRGIERASAKEVAALVTLPIHKKAWQLAGIPHAGHTEALREYFSQEAIMMMGKEGLFIALFSDHVPLSSVPSLITQGRLERFLENLARAIPAMERCGVLGLNPHAGDGGVLGSEESTISMAVKAVNARLGREIFSEPLVPDVAFLPHNRAKFDYFVAMYHDQGLIALKILAFEESVNISLGLPIIRTSVDHGTAFDIAYRGKNPSLLSYKNAIKVALKLGKDKK